MKYKTKLSIVIPNWLTKDGGKIAKEAEAFWFFKHCVDRIIENTKLPYELIIVDNGSTVGQDYMESVADKYIRNEKNLGFAVACNQGFSVCEGEYIVCLNNDILVYKNWDKALLKTFEDNDNCGLAMPALMKQTKDARVALEIDEPDLSSNYDKYGKGAEFGSLWVAKKELLDRLKEQDGYVFDERFKIGFGEDRNLYDRIRKMGYETYRTHKTRAFHQGNVSICKIDNRKQYTLPNRIYLRKLREAKKELTKQDKDILREEAQKEYENSLTIK